jgi:hypothetical protein
MEKDLILDIIIWICFIGAFLTLTYFTIFELPEELEKKRLLEQQFLEEKCNKIGFYHEKCPEITLNFTNFTIIDPFKQNIKIEKLK